MIVDKPKKKKKKISRYTGLLIVMAIIFAAITIKLAYLQIYKHDDYKEKADNTSTKFISEKAPRGKIYDQDGNILATNTQTYSVSFTSTDVSNEEFFQTMDKLYSIFEENQETVQDNLPVILKEDGTLAFNYSSTTPESQRIEELRFKKDRGFNEEIEKDLFGEIGADLTDNQINQLNDKLMEITPEEFFWDLVKNYGIINVLNPTGEEKTKYKDMSGKELTKILLDNGYDYKKIRDYLVVKDAIKIQSIKGYKSVTIASSIKRDTAFIIMQRTNELPGLNVAESPCRSYPYGELASSVIGYLSKISSANQDKYSLRGYDVSTDLVGVSGIEASFEEQLKGVKGGSTVKVNSSGNPIEELFKLESYPGNNVHLTIDKDIQYATEEALKDTMAGISEKNDGTGQFYKNATRGAAILVEVNTGRILSLVSYPGYDPNMFAVSGTLTSEQTAQYFNPDYESFGNEIIEKLGLNKTVDELFPKDSNGNRYDKYDLYPRPFFNYATQALLPPGSIFKPLTGLVGIEEGAVGVNETIYDEGIFTGNGLFTASTGPKCLLYTTNRSSHGATDIRKALEVSCNYYFYEVAYRLYVNSGRDINALNVIAEYAWKFGLGVDPNGQQEMSTGIEIEENFGQTFNYESWKNNQIYYARFELSEYLESGDYKGMYTFVPFDFAYRDNDSEKLTEAKTKLKDKISARLKQVGTDEENAEGHDAFAKNVLEEIKYIMNNSDTYKANVEAYDGNVDIDKQANIVAQAVAQFTVNDKSSEIKSPAQLIYASIGQGMNSFTPMQLASFASTLANGGTRYGLHLVDKITSPEGEIVQEFSPEVLDTIEISEETLEAIKEGMGKANNDDDGTAASVFRNFPISTGGKTGTADYMNSGQAEYGRAPYATYMSFAPLENPEVAFIGVIYDGGHGSWTAPVAKAAYEAYFKDRILEIDPDYASKSESFTNYVVNGIFDNKD